MMKYNNFDKDKLLTRRGFIIGGAKVGALTLLTGRLYHMQMIKQNDYATKSEKNRVNVLLTPPPRGNIVDRYGKLLAINQNSFKVMLNKRETSEYIESLKKVFALLSIPPHEQEILYKKAAKASPKAPISILENIAWETLAVIEENAPYLPGIFIEIGQLRFYPYNVYTSHVVGYTALMNEEEKRELNLQNVHEFKVGKRGIEQEEEVALQGKFGYKRMEVNAHGLYLRELSEVKSESGQEVQLNIDVSLQTTIHKMITHKSCSVIVQDIYTGEILTLISTPGYNPNEFSSGITHRYWNKLLTDKYKPLMNKTINSSYPPGSIFKMIVLLAALEAGVSPNFHVNCTGHIIVGNRKFRCWYKQGHGHMNMENALKHSCNSYLYTMAKTVGMDKIEEMARRFGFGEPTGIDLPGESQGFIPNRIWKLRRFKQAWLIGDTINASIGQGFILTTPIQLSKMITAIANGGTLITPKLIRNSPTEMKPLGISEDKIKVIQAGLFKVVNSPGGTSYRSRMEDPRYIFAGKTGTAQVVGKQNDNHDLSSLNIPWEQRTHALFVGYGPFDNPRYSCTLVMDHAGGGGSQAAPLGRDVLREVFKRYL